MDAAEQLEIETRIVGVLKSIYDPEIPVNIYDLGLIYNINIASFKVFRIFYAVTIRTVIQILYSSNFHLPLPLYKLQ